jgi:hypothetical protein
MSTSRREDVAVASFTAVVMQPAASEPAPGSVRPKEPNFSPLRTAGRKRLFCSSVAEEFMMLPA